MTTVPLDEERRYRNHVSCPTCGHGMLRGSTECFKCRQEKHWAESHTRTMAHRQEEYSWKLDMLREELARTLAEIERWERYCGLRP